MIRVINEENFEQEISAGTVLVDFYADWCGPCKMLAPILEEIDEERKDISVKKVNIDECNTLAVKYSIFSIPTMIVFQDGKETVRMIGYQSKRDILKRI